MGDEEAPLCSALARLADVKDEAAAAGLVLAVAHAARSLPSEARPAACSVLFGSSTATALAALERVAPSQSAELLEILLSHADISQLDGVEASALWNVLRGTAGLHATRWRTRAAAVRAACALSRAAPGEVAPADVAEALLLRLALDDTQREVRLAAGIAGAALLLHLVGGNAHVSTTTRLMAALLASCVEEDDELADGARRVLCAPSAPDIVEALTTALEAESSPDAYAPLGPPLVLLRAVRALLCLGAWRVGEQSLMHRMLNATATLLEAARHEPDVAAAASSCLAQVAVVARPAALAWYTAASTQPSNACALPAMLSAAMLALGGREMQCAPPTTAAAMAALHVTLAGLVPPRAVFGQEFLEQAAATSFADRAAQRLVLLPLVLALLPRGGLFPTGLRLDADAGWPAGGDGVDDGGMHPGPAAVLAAALYATGGSLHPEAQPSDGLAAWSNPAVAVAAEAVLDWLWQAAAPELRWRDREMLVAASLAARAPTLRRSLLVQELGTPYVPTAPTRFDAELAAQTMRSAVCRLGHPSATHALPAVFPCLLLALEHPAPRPRVHAQHAARHLAASATRTSLRVRAPVLWPLLISGLLGCEDCFWPPAVHAAAACAQVLGGDDPASPQYHELLSTLLTELGRRPGDAGRALPLLRAAAPLSRAMRLELLRHTKRFLPFLSDWAVSTEDEHRMLAAEALTAAMERIWPRAEHHAPMLWPVMLQSYELSANGPHEVATRAALERLAEQMHHAGGHAFASAWQASERKGDCAASVAPLMSRLLALREAAPLAAAEHAEAKVEPSAAYVEPPCAEDAAPSPTPPDLSEDALPELLRELHSAFRLVDEKQEHFSLPGVDLDALVADDARVTDALDAWAETGDAGALQLPPEQTGAMDDSECTLEELSQRADEELRAFMQELELRTRDAT